MRLNVGPPLVGVPLANYTHPAARHSPTPTEASWTLGLGQWALHRRAVDHTALDCRNTSRVTSGICSVIQSAIASSSSRISAQIRQISECPETDAASMSEV